MTALVGFSLRVFRRLRGVFDQLLDVGCNKVGLTRWNANSDSNTNATGIVVINGVLAKRQVDNAVYDPQFGQAVSENGIGFAVDNLPAFVANADCSVFGHAQSFALNHAIVSSGQIGASHTLHMGRQGSQRDG